MTSKERMRQVMTGGLPDRTPVMCQLSLGHIYMNSGIDPIWFWFTSEGLAEAYVTMARKYGFDGILVSVIGRDPALLQQIENVRKVERGHLIKWKNGEEWFAPVNDFPYPVHQTWQRPQIKSIDEIEIEEVDIIDGEDDLPPYYLDILNCVISMNTDRLSIHGEVGTAFERFLQLFGSYESGLMALLDDEKKSIQIMEKINRTVVVEALAQCRKGIDALKLSSPFAGSGFISRKMYKSFVLPFESEVICRVREQYDIPCYIHTCGAIGDRLDLIVETGTQGIECLDPYPLGNVDLLQAVEEIGDKVFIKGNIDSVNELQTKTPWEVREIARKRLAIGKACKKGFILSTACSVSPDVPPDNVLALSQEAEIYVR